MGQHGCAGAVGRMVRRRLRRCGLATDGQRENTCGHSCNDGNGRRECNADPHGTSLRRARGGARLCSVGRAPAIAYAPRTESGKASSVLAFCRRVCGRMCEGPGVVLGVSSLRRFQASPWWTGAPRLRQVYGCTTTFWKDSSRRLHHLPESVTLFCVGDPSSRVLRRARSERRCPLSWDDRYGFCEGLHNRRHEHGSFVSMAPR